MALLHNSPNQTRLIAKVIWELLKRERFETWADLTGAVKDRCLQLRLQVSEDALNGAYTLIGSNAVLVQGRVVAAPPAPIGPGKDLTRAEANEIYLALLERHFRERETLQPAAVHHEPSAQDTTALSAIAAQLSRYDERHVLAYFWNLIRSGADRHEALHHLSQVTIQRPPDWKPHVVRSAFEAERSSGRPRACFTCGHRERRLFRHHVIEIQHGGSNHLANRVPLCFPCHKRLHPWLTVEPPAGRAAGMESLGSIMARFQQPASGLLEELP